MYFSVLDCMERGGECRISIDEWVYLKFFFKWIGNYVIPIENYVII